MSLPAKFFYKTIQHDVRRKYTKLKDEINDFAYTAATIAIQDTPLSTGNSASAWQVSYGRPIKYEGDYSILTYGLYNMLRKLAYAPIDADRIALNKRKDYMRDMLNNNSLSKRKLTDTIYITNYANVHKGYYTVNIINSASSEHALGIIPALYNVEELNNVIRAYGMKVGKK